MMNIRFYLTLICFTNVFLNNYAAEERQKEEPKKLPIVFHEWYDISFGGLENVHPFDSKKYGKVHKQLIETVPGLTKDSFYTTEPVTDTELRLVHTQDYLDSLYNSWTLGQICCIPPLGLLPNILLRRYLLLPMRYATGGTIKAVELALDSKNEKKYAINLSGGYHHAKANSGDGFCVYADIPLAIEIACEQKKQNQSRIYNEIQLKKTLYIDTDAHHGNGVADYYGEKNQTGKWENNENTGYRDEWITKNREEKVVIFDMYSYPNYPGPYEIANTGKFVKYKYAITKVHTGEEYLNLLREELPNIIYNEQPDLIFYNAGTDPYKGDKLGHMQLSQDDIIKRDKFVFKQAKNYNIPIVMTLSGGYSKESADIIASSIKNIIELMDKN